MLRTFILLLLALVGTLARAAAPVYSGFDFELHEGDTWEYKWGHNCRHPERIYSGTFRVTLGKAKIIGEVTAYKINLSGDVNAGGTELVSRWKYLAVKDNQILGSLDGSSLSPIFDAQLGQWDNSGGFFTDHFLLRGSTTASVLDVVTYSHKTVSYISGSALTVHDTGSPRDCTRLPQGGWVCGGGVNFDTVEYYWEGIGPVGYLQNEVVGFSNCLWSEEFYIGLDNHFVGNTQSVSGEIEAGLADIWRISIVAEGTWTLYTRSETDTYGCLRDSTDRVLVCDDNSGAGGPNIPPQREHKDFRIVHQITQPGDYFVVLPWHLFDPDPAQKAFYRAAD